MRKVFLLVLVVALGGIPVMGAPSGGGVFQGAWPYDPPPAGHFNTFIPGNLGLGGLYFDLMEMPLATYLWAKGEYIPYLGTSWKMDVAKRTFTVKLRRGVRWSDGKPFTSADVASTFYINYLFGAVVWRYITGVDTPDDDTVIFRFTTPASVAERLILRASPRSRAVYATFADRAKPIAEAHRPLTDPDVRALTDELKLFRPKEMVVTGPFRIDPASITEAQLTLVKNPTSWAAEAVRFDRIVIFNGETPQITPLVLAKQIDYATHAFPTATDRQFQQLGIRVLRTPVYLGAALYFNHRLAPLNRKEVRQAIAYAINRDQNGTVALGPSGKGVKFLTGFSDNLLDLWIAADVRAKLNPYPYDPARGAQLLINLGFKKAGDGVWVSDKGERLDYELSVPAEFADWSAAAEDVAAQLTRFGVKVSVRGVPNPQHLQNVADGKFQLAIRLWGSGTPHLYFAYVQDLFNLNYIVNPTTRGMDFDLRQKTDALGEVDMASMIDSAGAGTNLGRQKSAASRLAIAFNELLPIIPLHERYLNSPALEGTRITGCPKDGDPIYKNNTADSYITIMILNGTLRPVGR